MAYQENLAIDLFAASMQMVVGRGTDRIVCAPEDCILTALHVRPHEQVICGDVLCEVVQRDEKGVAQIIPLVAPDWGIVKPVAGTKIFRAEQEEQRISLFLRKGQPLLFITREETGNDAGTIKGLTPRPTSVIARRRRRLLMMYSKH